MRNATRILVSTYGALAAVMGVEHGLGALLQGSRAPAGLVIRSWPESELFAILDGEPAMTLVPNLRASGLLSILVALLLLAWVTLFVERKRGGLVTIGLSIVLLLVGGGFGPPLLGLIAGLGARGLEAPGGCAGRSTGSLWAWLFTASLAAWLGLFPGTILLDRFVGIDKPELVVPPLTFSALGLTVLALWAARRHDARTPSPAPARVAG